MESKWLLYVPGSCEYANKRRPSPEDMDLLLARERYIR